MILVLEDSIGIGHKVRKSHVNVRVKKGGGEK
jgi:hypothetical protein